MDRLDSAIVSGLIAAGLVAAVHALQRLSKPREAQTQESAVRVPTRSKTRVWIWSFVGLLVVGTFVWIASHVWIASLERAATPASTLKAAALPPSIGWSTFSSKSGRFSVTGPGTPKETTRTAASPDTGPIEYHQFDFEALKRSRLLFMVAYADYPPQLPTGDPEIMLDGGVDRMVDDLRGRIVAERRITVGSHPGREVTVEVPSIATYRVRVCVVGRRLYMVVGATAGAVGASPEVARFLDSFRLES